MSKPQLMIMMKAPVMGNVKTRLAQDIGAVKACQFYRRNCHHMIARLSTDPRWHTHIAVTPANTLTSSLWPKNVSRIAQSRGDLGDRMQTLFDNLPPGPVIIIGTDIPSINKNHIADAFKALKKKAVIIGPSDDGGYWLIGQHRTPKIISLFENVRWSSQHTMTDTLANLKNQSYALIDTLKDVDTGNDYKSLNQFSTRVLSSNQ